MVELTDDTGLFAPNPEPAAGLLEQTRKEIHSEHPLWQWRDRIEIVAKSNTSDDVIARAVGQDGPVFAIHLVWGNDCPDSPRSPRFPAFATFFTLGEAIAAMMPEV